MSLSIKAKLVRILQVESGVGRTGNPWKKQEFVVETLEQYSRKVCFTLFNDKLSLLSDFSEGEVLEVSFDIESREFNNKWYHTLSAWKIDPAAPKSSGTVLPPLTEADVPPEPADGEAGDLPF